MTQVEQWRAEDDQFGTFAQNAICAMEEGRTHDALVCVLVMRRMYREQLSLALDMEPYGWMLGTLTPKRKGGIWG